MTPLTQLEAVNIMLSAIGETPVNSLTSGLVEAELAETILGQVSRTVQTMGWSFNRDTGVILAQDTNGEVPLALNVLSADSVYESNGNNLVQRGQKFWDRTNRTFTIGKSVKADLIYELDFTDIPPLARSYITVRSARIFQDRVVGSDSLHGFQKRDEDEALIALKDAEADVQDHNIFNNYDVFRVIDRGINGA
tara:strand:- start:955 stop:1536 length:582 start_codon:yes stop_codon:yes gene_type:complete